MGRVDRSVTCLRFLRPPVTFDTDVSGQDQDVTGLTGIPRVVTDDEPLLEFYVALVKIGHT